MIPDIEVQLQAVIKSLKDNVLPAIDAENALAQQQIQLSLATLGIALEHMPLVHSVARKDIESHVGLSKEILEREIEPDSATELKKAVATAESALCDPALGFVQLQQQARRLRAAVGQIIAFHADSDSAEEVEKLVLAASKTSLDMGRAWNKPMGFEPNPDAVKELVTQLRTSQ